MKINTTYYIRHHLIKYLERIKKWIKEDVQFYWCTRSRPVAKTIFMPDKWTRYICYGDEVELKTTGFIRNNWFEVEFD